MEFKEWLNEGYMRLPLSAYKDILEFYSYAKAQYELKPRANIPERTFPLDLRGTRWEFLQHLEPRVSVKIRNTEVVDKALGWYLGTSHNTGRIMLAAKSGKAITSTLEHELLHFLQDLVGIYASMKPDRRDKNPHTRIGGLPKKKISGDLLAKYGMKPRRSTHRLRPAEQMTNLNSHINDLRMEYLERTLRTLNINPNETTWRELLANRGFINMLSDRKEKSRMVPKIKDLHPESIKFYHKEIFKNFVDSADWPDTFEILKVRSTLRERQKEIRMQKEQQPQKPQKKTKELQMDLKGYREEDFGKGVKVKIDYYDISDFSNLDEILGTGYEDHEDYEDPLDSAQSMFNASGIKGNRDGDMQFSVAAANLKKIFDKIRQLKQAETNRIKRCNWDHFARKLASYAADKVDYFMAKSGKNIPEKTFLSIFYPDPTEECLPEADPDNT